jgi:hypothetical protein
MTKRRHGEYAYFATLDTKKLISNLISHELSRNDRPNHDASLTSKTLIISARVGGHDANPNNTNVSSILEFALSSLVTSSDEQYKSILDDEIALLVRKSQACAALSNLDISSDDSSSSEEDEKVKRKPGDFTGLCLMGKSSQHISDSDSDVSDDLSPEGLSLRVIELENALCNQDKRLCKVFCENKMLNLELEFFF